MDNTEVIATFERMILELSQPLYPAEKSTFHFAELLIMKDCIGELLDTAPKTALPIFTNEISFLRGLADFIEDNVDEAILGGIQISHQLTKKNLTDRIKNNKKITLDAHPINALLYSELTLTSYSQTQYLAYKSLFLLSAIRMYLGEGKDTQIRSICAEGRLYTDKTRKSLLKVLPDASNLTFTELVRELKSLEQNYKQQLATEADQLRYNHYKDLTIKLAKYRVIFQKSLDNQPTHQRAYGARTPHYRTRLILSDIEHVSEYISTQDIVEVSIEKEPDVEVTNIEDELQTQHRITSIVHFTDNKSNTRRALQARAIAEDKPVRAMHCSSSTNQGSSYEITTFIDEAFDQFEKGEYKQEALSLFLTLILGNDLVQIRKLRYEKEENDNALIIREHLLPTQSQRAEVRGLITLVDTSYRLALPSFIGMHLNDFSFDSVTHESQQSFITYINKRKNTSLTRHKIQQHISHIHTNLGVNELYTALIKGSSLTDVVILNYSQSSYNQLMRENEDYIDYLASLTHHIVEPIQSQVLPIDKKLGSPFYQLPKLKALTCSLKQHVNNAQIGGIQSESFHNLYTLYLYYNLSLSTGYRPITGMFGKLEDINLRSGRYRINDKNALPGNSDRTVFLPHLAKHQLHEYIKHLTHIANFFPYVEDGFAERCQAALSSQSPLLFFLEDGKVEELGVSYLNEKLDKVFPLQLNWHRHYAASLFLENSLHSDSIKAWMGHSNNGMVAFNKFSNLSIGKLKEIGELLNTYLQYVGMDVIHYD